MTKNLFISASVVPAPHPHKLRERDFTRAPLEYPGGDRAHRVPALAGGAPVPGRTQVPSALEGLTAVFGMGTGVSPSAVATRNLICGCATHYSLLTPVPTIDPIKSILNTYCHCLSFLEVEAHTAILEGLPTSGVELCRHHRSYLHKAMACLCRNPRGNSSMISHQTGWSLQHRRQGCQAWRVYAEARIYLF